VANLVPTDLEALLRRRDTAAALTASGFPMAEATLATRATRGGGPPYRVFGKVPLYRWGDALEWADNRLSPPRRSSSEADVTRASIAKPPGGDCVRGSGLGQRDGNVCRGNDKPSLVDPSYIPSKKAARGPEGTLP